MSSEYRVLKIGRPLFVAALLDVSEYIGGGYAVDIVDYPSLEDLAGLNGGFIVYILRI